MREVAAKLMRLNTTSGPCFVPVERVAIVYPSQEEPDGTRSVVLVDDGSEAGTRLEVIGLSAETVAEMVGLARLYLPT